MTLICESSFRSGVCVLSVVRAMLVPEMLCGDTKTVAAACRRHIARFKKGGSWLDAGPMIDIQKAPGLIMIGSQLYGVGRANVHVYAPFWQLENAFVSGSATPETTVRAFDEALGNEWSALGLLSPICHRLLQDRERAE